MYLIHLLQEGPAQTSGYMFAGYTIIFGVMLLYVISLYIRKRNLEQDVQVLEELDQHQE